jgi:hypothetical protein
MELFRNMGDGLGKQPIGCWLKNRFECVDCEGSRST